MPKFVSFQPFYCICFRTSDDINHIPRVHGCFTVVSSACGVQKQNQQEMVVFSSENYMGDISNVP